MKFQQLVYVREVARCNLNVSQASKVLYTSQPGISKQIKLLEEELGIELFERSGKHLVSVTPVGEKILTQIEEILALVDGIKHAATEFSDEDYGTLSIATTHTQAKFTLPSIVGKFVKKYPNVHFQMHQCTPDESVEMASRGEVDIALWTETAEKGENLIKMPCYKWSRSVIVPKGHPLTKIPKLKLKDLASYPIVTYVFGFTGSNDLDRAFFERGLKANVVFTATDADVIKTYVKMGTGVGIIASMAFNEEEDSDLVSINANHLFDSGTTYMGFRRGTYLRGHLFEFINMFAPHLKKEIVAKACSTKSKKELDKVFESIKLLRR
jgi:LysR family cys regulon transcriptional activator